MFLGDSPEVSKSGAGRDVVVGDGCGSVGRRECTAKSPLVAGDVEQVAYGIVG